MNAQEAMYLLMKHLLRHMVMNMGGQAVVPMASLEGNDTHIRVYLDNANDAIILTVVPDEAAVNAPEASKF
jgi:hypothetical protein